MFCFAYLRFAKKFINSFCENKRILGFEVKNMLVVKAKIKEIAGDFNVAGDFADALNKKTEQLVKEALDRAKANNRRTVMAKDI
jgi:hypothetical protein